MELEEIDGNNPQIPLIEKAAFLLKKGKLIIHPTETVYGIAGNYLQKEIIHRVIRLKSRASSQPFSIMVNTIEQIFEICGDQPDWMVSFIHSILPDAITLILRRKKKVNVTYWNQFPYLGFRFPRHLICNMLLEETKFPVITTSANHTGDKPPATIEQIPERVKENVELVLDGGITPAGIPSTIIQIDESPKKITLIRKGAVSWKLIEKKFRRTD